MKRGWLVPAGLCAAGLVVAVLATPGFMKNEADRDLASNLPAERPTDLPTTLSRSAEPSNGNSSGNTGVRMGMRPIPQRSPSPATASVFEADGLRVGVRFESSQMLLFLPDISGERIIDTLMLTQGEEPGIEDVFELPASNLVAIRIRVDDARFWRIYRPSTGTFARDDALSQRVINAQDRAEVARLLAEN